MMEELIEEVYYLLWTMFQIGTNHHLPINNWLLLFKLHSLNNYFYTKKKNFRLTIDNTL